MVKKKNKYKIGYGYTDNTINFIKNNKVLQDITIKDIYKYLSVPELKLVMKTIINNKLAESMNNYEEIRENDFIKK